MRKSWQIHFCLWKCNWGKKIELKYLVTLHLANKCSYANNLITSGNWVVALQKSESCSLIDKLEFIKNLEFTRKPPVNSQNLKLTEKLEVYSDSVTWGLSGYLEFIQFPPYFILKPGVWPETWSLLWTQESPRKLKVCVIHSNHSCLVRRVIVTFIFC